MAVFCGGATRQHNARNQGRCGLCGRKNIFHDPQILISHKNKVLEQVTLSLGMSIPTRQVAGEMNLKPENQQTKCHPDPHDAQISTKVAKIEMEIKTSVCWFLYRFASGTIARSYMPGSLIKVKIKFNHRLCGCDCVILILPILILWLIDYDVQPLCDLDFVSVALIVSLIDLFCWFWPCDWDEKITK